MAMNYEYERHIESYLSAGQSEAAKFMQAQRDAFNAFIAATGAKELPLEEAENRIVSGITLESGLTVTYQMLANPDAIKLILKTLYSPYLNSPDSRATVIRGYNAILRDSNKRGDQYSMLDLLSRPDYEILEIENFGKKSLEQFRQLSLPLSEYFKDYLPAQISI